RSSQALPSAARSTVRCAAAEVGAAKDGVWNPLPPLPPPGTLEIETRRGGSVGNAAQEQPARYARTQKYNLRCAACGYGVSRRPAPDRCPMCQSGGPWVHALWRPFTTGL